jgi:hypothetical protein
MNPFHVKLTPAYAGYFLIALLALLVFNNLQWGRADLAKREALYGLQQVSGGTAASSDRQEIESRLRQVLALVGPQPDVYETLGKYYLQEVHRHASAPVQRYAYLNRALGALTEAVQLRPGSPYTWANIALVKYYLGQPDAKFRMAIHNAVLLGAKSREVQLIISEVGLASWDQLDASTQDDVKSLLREALQVQPEMVHKIAENSDRLETIKNLR